MRHPGVRVAHVTDGAPRELSLAQAGAFETREEYASAREAEARSALTFAGIPAAHRVTLGLVEQEAPLRLSELTRALRRLFDRWHPTTVITHAFEGEHPDDDAVSFAVRAAASLIAAERGGPPRIVEMTSHHRSRGGSLEPGVFRDRGEARDLIHRLSAEERQRKRALLSRYVTQRGTLGRFPLEVERFRPAPRYDYTQAPHEGTLGYESLPWGMTWGRFCDLVRYALLELGLRQVTALAPGTV